MAATMASATIKKDGFNPIKPFNAENSLNPNVQSDHAEIGIRLPNFYTLLNSWNISNPNHHRNFALGDVPVFKETHMFVKEPVKEGKLDPSLLEKINSQIAVILDRMEADEVHVQVIIEGSEYLLNKLKEEINVREKNAKFEVFSMLDTAKPKDWNVHSNVSAILLNKQSFSVLSKNVKFIKYNEEADQGKPNEWYLPYMHVRDNSNNEIVIAAAHVRGVGSQYPKTGLEMVAEKINDLFLETVGKADIFVIGDFNAPPMHAKESLLKRVKIPCQLIDSDYFTHVNPKGQAAKYDYAVVAGRNDKIDRYSSLSVKATSSATQALVKDIEKSLV